MYDPFGIGFDWGGGSGAVGAAAGGGDPNLAVLLALSPVALYPMAEGTGTQFTDASGNGRHAAFAAAGAAPTWVASPASASFDGGDRATVTLPAVQGWDIVFKYDVAINAGLTGDVALGFVANDDENGLIFGNFTGGLTDEIVAVGQNTTGGFPLIRRRAWLEAAGEIAADGWHLLQCDLRAAGDPHWTILLDGSEKGNTGGALNGEFPTGDWAIGNAVGSTTLGITGDLAYVVFYGTERTDQQQADCRAALAAIMAARGVTLP